LPEPQIEQTYWDYFENIEKTLQRTYSSLENPIDTFIICVVYEKKAHLAFNNFCLILLSKLVFRQNQRILVDEYAKTVEKVKNQTKKKNRLF
jgi:hypothetical protein